MSVVWFACAGVLALLATADFVQLWRLGRAKVPSTGLFSPFTLAAQGAFALVGALFVAAKTIEGFSASLAIAVNAFLVLMLAGAARDWRSRAVARAAAAGR